MRYSIQHHTSLAVQSFSRCDYSEEVGWHHAYSYERHLKKMIHHNQTFECYTSLANSFLKKRQCTIPRIINTYGAAHSRAQWARWTGYVSVHISAIGECYFETRCTYSCYVSLIQRIVNIQFFDTVFTLITFALCYTLLAFFKVMPSLWASRRVLAFCTFCKLEFNR